MTNVERNTITDAKSHVKNSEVLVDDIGRSITDGRDTVRRKAESQSNAHSGDQSTGPQPEAVKSQNITGVVKENDKVKEINKRVENINRIFNDWNKKRLGTLEEIVTIPLIYGPESSYTYYEYQDRMSAAQAKVEQLSSDQHQLSARLNKALTEARDIDSTHIKLPSVEKRIRQDEEYTSHLVEEHRQWTSGMSDDIRSTIDSHTKNPAAEVERRKNNIESISRGMNIKKYNLSSTQNTVNSTLGPVVTALAPRATRSPSALHSLLNLTSTADLEDLRRQGWKETFAKLCIILHFNRGETNMMVRNAESELSKLIEESKYMQNGNDARSHMKAGEDKLKEIKLKASNINTETLRLTDGLERIYPDMKLFRSGPQQ